VNAGDEAFMRLAIEAARENHGLTDPNPSVGCVLARDGEVLATAATAPGGRPHAEEQALDLAGGAAHGATAYVTLEPCGARSSGGTACAARLAEAGVRRVVIACEDPSPFASGQGVERLRAAGIAVESGLLSDEAAPLYEAWLAAHAKAAKG
jgi:diaminohydroxyphosphoribosylaminopyrimidine deaminase/5-amino-6-(5-phosphoribosylamino)uracil reductase